MDDFYTELLKYWRFKVQAHAATEPGAAEPDSAEPCPDLIEIPDGVDEEQEEDLSEVMEVIKQEPETVDLEENSKGVKPVALEEKEKVEKPVQLEKNEKAEKPVDLEKKEKAKKPMDLEKNTKAAKAEPEETPEKAVLDDPYMGVGMAGEQAVLDDPDVGAGMAGEQAALDDPYVGAGMAGEQAVLDDPYVGGGMADALRDSHVESEVATSSGDKDTSLSNDDLDMRIAVLKFLCLHSIYLLLPSFSLELSNAWG